MGYGRRKRGPEARPETTLGAAGRGVAAGRLLRAGTACPAAERPRPAVWDGRGDVARGLRAADARLTSWPRGQSSPRGMAWQYKRVLEY